MTEYSYDLVGNLSRTVLANGIITEYSFDELNRLVKQVNYLDDVEVNGQYDEGDDTLVGQYEYSLDVFGGRTSLLEIDPNGVESKVDWFYDAMGRMTAEQYDFDTSVIDGDDYLATYEFDLVGNRLKKEVDKELDQDVDEIFTYEYDRNDRLFVETFDDTSTGSPGSIEKTTTYEYGDDADPGVWAGSGTQQTKKTVWEGTDTSGTGTKLSETTYQYNLQGRLSKVSVDADGDGANPATTTEYEYSDEGVKISEKNVGTGEVTTYLIDAKNLTGYAKAIEERIDGILNRSYTFGQQIIDQTTAGTTPETRYFVLDGHGRTRALADALAAIAEVYRFDAYGEAVGFNPVTAGTTWLTGDGQYNPASGLTYHLERWRQGYRFITLDPFAGDLDDPLSLHKYLYVHGDPINGIDPTGLATYRQALGYAAEAAIQSIYAKDHPLDSISWGKNLYYPSNPPGRYLRPDIQNFTKRTWAEIKPFTPTGVTAGLVQYYVYKNIYTWLTPDTTWSPSTCPASVETGIFPCGR